MDKYLLKNILANKDRFVPLIFTPKQMAVLEKSFRQEKLTPAEKKSLYTSVTKKIRALELIRPEPKDEFYIKGGELILPERIAEAKEIIRQFPGQEVFIAGSFLFSRNYNDIDIHILKERGYKEIIEGNKHLIYLARNKLKEAVFQSAALISVSNFENTLKPKPRKIFLSQLMSLYHEAIIELMQNDRKKENLRELIFSYHYICQRKLVDAYELKKIAKKIRISEADGMFKSLCRKLFSRTYLYIKCLEYIQTLKESIKNIAQNIHLKHYLKIYEELIYGTRGNPAEAD